MARSIQQLPNNTTTAQTEAVYTQTGFNAGDAVYYQNGDYVSPTVTPSAFANPTGSLTFTPTQTGPICSSGVDDNVGGVSPVMSGTKASGYGFKGGSKAKSTAVLSDGNIVNVWLQTTGMSNPGRPHFQITTPDGVQVVAPTLISSTFFSTAVPSITVCALTGGGFAVAWQVTNGGTALKPCTVVYTNAGAVTRAVTQETTAPTITNATPVNLTALTDGGFVFLVRTNAGIVWYRGYNAAGTAAYAWSSAMGGSAGGTSVFGVASRSNNGGEFIIADWVNSTDIQYWIINYTGNVTYTNQYSTNAVTSSTGGVACTTLTDNKFVIGYSGTNTTLGGQSAAAFNTVQTDFTFNSTVQVSYYNQDTYTSSNPNCKSVQLLGLSTGGFIFAFLDGTVAINYVFYNADGTPASQTNANGALPYVIPNSFIQNYWVMSLVETSGFVRAYWSPCTTTSAIPANIFTAKISMSTYLVTYANSFTANVTPASTSAASTINLASSTLTNAKYNLVSNLTTTAAQNVQTVLTASATIANGCDGVHSATLTNGSLAVAYQVGGIDQVRVNIYSVDLVLQQTIEVAQAFAAGYFTRIIALTGGGFVVAYGSGGSELTFVSYNSSYVELYRQTYSPNGMSEQANYSIAALTENKYAVVVSQDGSGNATLNVYSGSTSGSLYQNYINSTTSFGPWTTATVYYLQIIGNNYGGFMITGRNSGTGAFAANYIQTAANTWAYTNAISLSQTTGSLYQNQGSAYNGAGVYLYFTTPSTSSTSHNINAIADGTSSGNNNISTLTSVTNNANSFENAIGLTGIGTFVVVTLANVLQRIYGMPGVGSLANAGTDGTGTAFVTFPGEGRAAVTSSPADGSNNLITVSPTVGNRAFLVYKNTSSQPVITTIVAYPAFATTFVPNTQVSSNAAVSINPQLNNTSTTISGTIFAGVAATTASAGSTGLLVTNGLAQLNSSYPAVSAQNVDTTGFAVAGVKGVLKNRVINMQGNT